MKRTPAVHPFLFSLFPILALYAHNIKSIPISFGELVGPLTASLVCTTAVFLVLRTALKDAAKPGLLASLLLLGFFSFGHIAGQLAVWTGGFFNRSLFFAWAITLGLIAFLVVRSRRTFIGLTKILNGVSATLVILNLASIGLTLARRPHIVFDKDVKVSRQPASRPNIYYIVLDAYTRADILEEVFSFDNSGFLAGLEAKGFYVASKSCSNYSQTHLSLASSLNFTLLDELAKELGPYASDRDPLQKMIQDNRTMAFLKGQGYRLISIASGMELTELKNVDRYRGFKQSTSEFRNVLLNTTPLPLFLGLSAGHSPYDAHRERILSAFRALEESPFEKGPFFLFVHIMCPHPPFVFGPAGEPIEPDYSYTLHDADRMPGIGKSGLEDYLEKYRGQLTFLNKKLEEAVGAILARSSEPPVIILQGDHGTRAYLIWEHPEASYFRENLSILNAYCLPGIDRALLYPGISPVNTFRLIFREYFGADLERLDDRSYWSTWRFPYRFLPFDENTYRPTVESFKAGLKTKQKGGQKR